MARKKRQVAEQFQTPAQPDDKKKVAYQDEFQRNINKKIDDVSHKFEGKGKNILYAIAAVAVLAALIGIFYAWNRRSNQQAQAALGKAIETSSAQVTDSPLPAGSTAKTFKTEKERADASIADFQAVADKFGGAVGDKARYFVAVNKLFVDRAAAVSELETLAGKSGDVGKLSKFALAQAKTTDGDLDRAAALYQELAGMDDAVVAKDTVNFELAKVFEKQGKKAEAADLYFNIAKTASEAKDLDNKPVPLSTTATDAKSRLEELNPEKAKEIKQPESAPTTGMPFGM
jgi:ATP/maltotriose-dependent transcriptional regulator MalT